MARLLPLLVCLFASLVSAFKAHRGAARLSRRAALAYAAPTLALPSLPHPVLAVASPTKELNELVELSRQLDQFATEVQGLSASDSSYVLRFSLTLLAPAATKLKRTAEVLELLAPPDRSKLETLANDFSAHVLELTDACRAGEVQAQRASVRAVQKPLSEYLTLAGTAYALQTPGEKPAFSPSDYFGFFSCEGMGMDRAPGSNKCIPRS